MSSQDFGMLPRVINASIAGLVGVTCVFPLDLAKTRWQNTPASVNGAPRPYNSYGDCFLKTFKSEGLRGMYKGSSVNLLLITPEKVIKLVANDGFRYLLKKSDGSLPMHRQVLAGASAGMCQIVITTPMELLKIALQDAGRTAVKSDGASVQQVTATQVAKNIIKTKGVAGLFHGGTSTFVRDVFFSSLYFPMFATFNDLGTKEPESGKPAFYHTFFSGLLAGSLSSYIATPLDVIKTRIQTPNQTQYTTVTGSFMTIVKNESPAALFKGAIARVCVVAPLFGIAQMMYYLGVAESLLGMKPTKQI